MKAKLWPHRRSSTEWIPCAVRQLSDMVRKAGNPVHSTPENMSRSTFCGEFLEVLHSAPDPALNHAPEPSVSRLALISKRESMHMHWMEHTETNDR